MVLKKEKRKAVSINPGTLLLYGAPKIGKTTMLSVLDDCLIIDTEKGGRMLEGYITEVNSRKELIETLLEIKDSKEIKVKRGHPIGFGVGTLSNNAQITVLRWKQARFAITTPPKCNSVQIRFAPGYATTGAVMIQNIVFEYRPLFKETT